MAFQILADVAKTNIDILETIQLLAQGKYETLKMNYLVYLAESTSQLPLHKRAESHLLSRGWRSWPWQLIILLCECLTSICISTEQALIKRTVLFGTETSSDNILAYASDINEQKTVTENSTIGGNDDSVCLMHMLKYRATDEYGKIKINDGNDQSWRIHYMGLLCMSQVYKHLKNESRYKTLSNLLWMFINQYERHERDDRILEALKVGRVRNKLI
jgi:hypothetical protein